MNRSWSNSMDRLLFDVLLRMCTSYKPEDLETFFKATTYRLRVVFVVAVVFLRNISASNNTIWGSILLQSILWTDVSALKAWTRITWSSTLRNSHGTPNSDSTQPNPKFTKINSQIHDTVINLIEKGDRKLLLGEKVSESEDAFQRDTI
eukprot:gene8857-18352_t